MTITDFENGFKHIASNIIADLETGVQDLAGVIEKEWPTIEDLLTSGQIGKDILKGLALIEPLLSIVEMACPESKPLITWAEGILEQIAALKIFNTPCACAACSQS
jgi:hypothetical protein